MKRPSLLIASTLLALAVLLSGCAPPGARGSITLSGAYALHPMVTRWAEEYQRLHPGVAFEISNGGAGRGMTDVLAGAVDLAMVSRRVTPEEQGQGAYAIPVVRDAVFPMINRRNPVAAEIAAQGLSPEVLSEIFISGEITTWGATVGRPDVADEIHVYTRLDSSGAAETWSLFLGGDSQSDLVGVGVSGEPALLQALIADPLGISYNNLGYAFNNASGEPVEGVVPAPVDLNGNGVADDEEVAATMSTAADLIATGKYPAPPARDLNLVAKGRPTGRTADFLLWVLTDGQEFVDQAGYVQLAPEQLEASLQLVR